MSARVAKTLEQTIGKDSGQIIINLGRNGLAANVSQTDSRLEIEFANASITSVMEMRLDVSER